MTVDKNIRRVAATSQQGSHDRKATYTILHQNCIQNWTSLTSWCANFYVGILKINLYSRHLKC